MFWVGLTLDADVTVDGVDLDRPESRDKFGGEIFDSG